MYWLHADHTLDARIVDQLFQRFILAVKILIAFRNKIPPRPELITCLANLLSVSSISESISVCPINASRTCSETAFLHNSSNPVLLTNHSECRHIFYCLPHCGLIFRGQEFLRNHAGLLGSPPQLYDAAPEVRHNSQIL